MRLVLRAIVSFLVLPCTVAGIIPYLIVKGRAHVVSSPEPGLMVAAVGLAVLLACARDFLVLGRGTLAPWDPPRHLVVTGLYRFVRNPMYVGVLAVLAGWALVLGSWELAAYGALVALVFHLRVLTYEEPRLRSSFAGEWERYRASVPRWIPRLPAPRPPQPPIPPGSRSPQNGPGRATKGAFQLSYPLYAHP